MINNDPIGNVPETPAEALAGWRQMRERIHDAFEQAKSAQQRAALLALHQSVMNLAEKAMDPKDLEKFREIRGHSYSLLVVRECLVGEKVCPKTAAAVTAREVAAGRMAPNHDLRNMQTMTMFAAQVLHSRRLVQKQSPASTGLMWRALSWLLN